MANHDYGYFYQSFGWFQHNFKDRLHGDTYQNGDIISVWLDLKAKYQLSFGVNDQRFWIAANVRGL